MNEQSIFSTPIWGYVLNNERPNISVYINEIIRLANTTASARKSNFGGWQSNDSLHINPIFKPFVNTLSALAANIVPTFTARNHGIQSMWANINYTNNFNAHHTHEGWISGVFYLQVPPNSGRLVLTNPNIRSYNSPVKQKDFPITPEPLACILFPSWLEHYVEPNQAEMPRISISFNIGEV
jgi:uncharacterized protein (TIGR02466 family)